MLSLNRRLLLVASAVLLGFFTGTALTLERAFRQSLDTSLEDQLQTQIYLLLGAAELTADGRLLMPDVLAEPRLATSGSGLVGAVWSQGERLWQSDSALGEATPLIEPAEFNGPQYRASSGWLHFDFPVIWELETGEQPLTFQVAISRATADRELGTFRRNLVLGLGGTGLALLIAQALALRWGLQPLRGLIQELKAIERGDRHTISAHWPFELLPLTRSLNDLLQSSASRLKRYRQTLDDLAHSLKTPIAVLGTLDGPDLRPAQRTLLREQTARIDQAIAYFTARGASAGGTALTGGIKLQDAAASLLNALKKVHGDKHVDVTTRIEPDLLFYGDPADLSELLGNLLDNAFKWCAREVRLTAETETAGMLHLTIEDDGPGIPQSRRDDVLRRGGRLDMSRPGQGIGLALVKDMVEEAYCGSIAIDTSELGGALIRIRLPQRSLSDDLSM